VKKLLLTLILIFYSSVFLKSQTLDTSEICLPTEQVRALLIDAQLTTILQEEKVLQDSIILEQEKTIVLQDSTIILFKKRIAIQESLVRTEEAPVAYKYLELILIFLSGIGLGGLIP
jgi:hypothetical protein